MAENKFVVKTVFHDENGDTLLREDYRRARKHRAQRIWLIWLCRTFGKVKRKLPPRSLNAMLPTIISYNSNRLCRSDTSSRVFLRYSVSELKAAFINQTADIQRIFGL